MVSVGVYGLLANLVEQRARELAIRMALGAQKADVFKMILGKGPSSPQLESFAE